MVNVLSDVIFKNVYVHLLYEVCIYVYDVRGRLQILCFDV